jgi:hypothetical protein
VKSLLDAEELAGNRNGLRGQDISGIASSQSFGQLLILGVSSVHTVGVIPLDAVLLKRSKALVVGGMTPGRVKRLERYQGYG